MVVWKLDRLGRSVTEVVGLAERFHNMGVGLHILTGTLEGTYSPTGSGKFFFTIMAALAVISSSSCEQAPDLGRRVEDGVVDQAA
ncbi:MAG: recombinase family protein [Pseudonocardiaceae bacterium]